VFERYTESARRALFFARYEVTERGGHSIETEHLLLGLIRRPPPRLSRLFREAQTSASVLRVAIERRLIETQRVPTSVEIPFSPAAKRVLAFTAEEADRLSHRQIDTEHMLLALMREPETLAGSVLAEHGFRLQATRLRVAEMAGEPEEPPLRVQPDEVMAQIDRIQGLVERFARDAVNRGASSSDAMAIIEEIESLRQHLEEHLDS
jgi:ATP-dependent Clp protease ATP-binding subunit ClpC